VATRRILVYDSSVSGHHPDYLSALYEFIAWRCDDIACTFVVPAAFSQLWPLQDKPKHIEFRFLDDSECAQIRNLSAHKRAVYELTIIETVLTQAVLADNPFDECILMYLDYFQAALTRSKANLSVKIVGILFQPYTRIEKVAKSQRRYWSLLFKSWRKRYRLSRLLSAGIVERICVPGDEYAVSQLRSRHGSNVEFVTLPEPYFSDLNGVQTQSSEAGTTTTQINIKSHYKIDLTRKVVLVFGRIIERKNVPNIIHAFQQLPSAIQSQTSLLILGGAAAPLQSEIQREVATAALRHPHVQIIYDPSYIDRQVAESAFAQCAFVAMPYQKAYQSSGILFLAAKHGKPVLASHVGLIADWVAQYSLGHCVDPQDVHDIASGIQHLVKRSGNMSAENDNLTRTTVTELPQAVQRFLLLNTPDRHASVLLGVPFNTRD